MANASAEGVKTRRELVAEVARTYLRRKARGEKTSLQNVCIEVGLDFEADQRAGL